MEFCEFYSEKNLSIAKYSLKWKTRKNKFTEVCLFYYKNGLGTTFYSRTSFCPEN